jgi:hypothetical protein
MLNLPYLKEIAGHPLSSVYLVAHELRFRFKFLIRTILFKFRVSRLKRKREGWHCLEEGRHSVLVGVVTTLAEPLVAYCPL